jgi:toxin FitB
VTADTSAVIAGLSAWHEQHEEAARALAGVRALPAHVVVEAYAVLTRLPGGLAVAPGAAAGVLRRRFDERPLRLGAAERSRLVERLAQSGVSGGASYDGLVALEAGAHRRLLLTLDERAAATYRRLGVDFELIGA